MTGQPRRWADRLAAAGDLPDGEERAVELDRIASAADAAGDLATGLDARFALMDLYLRRGERWRLFEPVRRCRELLDAASADATAEVPTTGPVAERAAELRRYQRFAVEAAFGTPRVGLGQTRAALDGLARPTPGLKGLARPAPGGAGDPAVSDLVAELRCRLADHLGDEPEARRWYDRWRTAPADPAAGCPACAPSRRADLLAGWGDWAAALAELRPIVDGPTAATPAETGGAETAGADGAGTAGGGGAYCTDQPERALAGALLPLLRAGEPERAGRAHVTAYRRHRRERTAFGQLAAHLRFCALGGHLDRGLDILAEQLPRLDRPSDDLAAMEFAAAGALLCALAAEAGRGDRRMPGPAAPTGRGAGRAGDDIDVARLGGLLAELATGLAGSFDARNGTGHQSGRIAALLAERPVAGPVVPLPADEAADDGGSDDDGGNDEFDEDRDGSGKGGSGPAGREAGRELAGDEVGALTVALVTQALDRRGDAWTMRGPAVVGRWGPALIEFRQAGERGEILHARVLAVRRLAAGRRAEAYAFCNAWNHDRLLPKAYAHDDGSGELVLAGDVTTDLAHGVAPTQLDVLVTAAVATGVAYAEAVAALP
ncbi:Putative sensory transduction regulator [Micromonospora haikouensis]|uniref:Putative sensory transduction regulator n=1 Tax=Micromonospora haikouensis TaxID=686309 RepID=A0A1C4V3H3_9ACTN|nr:YbjN domain-containing protein [Micromonospora haikouensis]SCE78447.1 Putative sensory transduction regulator [Micromonospora haikouensis]